MHRSSSNTKVADDYYRNSSSYFSTPDNGDNQTHGHGNPNINNNVNNSNGNLPIYTPGSQPAKKEKSRLRSAENAVHLIPLVLVLCAIILWFSSNPVEVVSKKAGSITAKIEGFHGAAVGIDGTQNSVHLELEDHDLHHHQQRQQQQTIDKKRSI